MSRPVPLIIWSALLTLILINASGGTTGPDGQGEGSWSSECRCGNIFTALEACCSRSCSSWMRGFRNLRSWGEGAPQFADHSHTFRSEMAGARRIRYQPADYRSGVDRERGSDRARPRGDWRRAGQHESTRDFCDGVCRPTAGSQGESARTEAGTPE
jgi:hypothetical protein